MKKIYCKLLFVLLLVSLVIVGCSKEEEKSEQDKLIEDMAREFDRTDKDSYKDCVAMLIEGEPVYVDEVMWYIFLIEDSMKPYSETYEGGTGESYWEQSIDDTVTMGQKYTDDIINQIAYNQILYSLALKEGMKCDEEAIAAEAKEVMANMSKEDIEKFGLTEAAYVKMHVKWELVDKYIESLKKDCDINEEQLRKENPIENFTGKLNTEFIIVLHTYNDENGEKQVYDNESISKLIEELEKAREEVLGGKSMKDVAAAYDNVLYFESNFYEGTQSAVGIYEDAAKALKTGEVSDVIRDALSTYVIRRLEDTKDKDYENYIKDLLLQEQSHQAESQAEKITEDAFVKLNDNVWKSIGVGKNNS